MTDQLNRTAIMEMMKKMSVNEVRSVLDLLNFKDVVEVMELLNSTNCYNRDDMRASTDMGGASLMTLYLPPIIFIVGLIGNGLSFAVLCRRPMRKISAYSYLTVLSLSDTVVLCIGFSKMWVAVVRPDLDLRLTYDILCRLTHMLGSTVSDFSVWLIVVVTVERYVVVCHPLKRSLVCRRRYACIVILCLLVFTLLLNCHLFWTTRLRDQNENCVFGRTHQCTFAEGHEFLVSHVWPWVDAMVYSFLPFVAILIFNSLIVRAVAKSKRKREYTLAASQGSTGHSYSKSEEPKEKFNKSNKSSKSLEFLNKSAHDSDRVKVTFMEVTSSEGNKGQNGLNLRVAKVKKHVIPLSASRECGSSSRLGLMLLTVSCFFLVTTLPMNATLIVTVLLKGFVSERSLGAKMEMVHKISEMLMYVNHSINFYLYCSTGAKFRRELFRMFSCKPERPWRMSTSTNVCQATSSNHPRNNHHHHNPRQLNHLSFQPSSSPAPATST